MSWIPDKINLKKGKVIRNDTSNVRMTIEDKSEDEVEAILERFYRREASLFK